MTQVLSKTVQTSICTQDVLLYIEKIIIDVLYASTTDIAIFHLMKIL